MARRRRKKGRHQTDRTPAVPKPPPTGRQPPKPAGYHWDQVEPVVYPDGRRGCRWCKRIVPTHRHSWCGDPVCLFEWKRRTTWALTRRAVFDRDGGICALCGFNAVRAETELREALARRVGPGLAHAALTGTHVVQYEREGRLSVCRVFEPEPFPADLIAELAARHFQPTSAYRPRKSLWEVDHIRPVSQGGAWFDMSNLRTLCPACHLAKTTRENAERRRATTGVRPCSRT